MTFSIAQTVQEALAALADGARPIAGGTDLVVGARQGKDALPSDLVAIDRLDELSRIEVGDARTRIGAGVTHARLMQDRVVRNSFTAVADAAALVGSPATRNVGTLGGNVMNGSPAMDTGAPLVVLGAVAELQTSTGRREVALDELWTGPGQTSADPGELCTALIFPNRPPAPSGSAYVRLEYRRTMEIAVVGAAAAVTLGGDASTVESVRVALTAVAPTIIELTDLGELSGIAVDDAAGLDDAALAKVAAMASAQATPISDLRASDRYRSKMVGVMARRAVEAATARAAGERVPVPVNRAQGIGVSL